jgi:hypothetical protein
VSAKGIPQRETGFATLDASTTPPRRIILDFDATDDPLHREQES